MRFSGGALEDWQRGLIHLLTQGAPILGEREDVTSQAAVKSTNRFWTPPVDVIETPDALQIVVELPGVDMGDVSIRVEDDTLAIKGERRQQATAEQQHHRIERDYGPFQRVFQLPSNVRPDGIKAALKNGLLTVTLPKAEEARRRQIEIQVDK